jgi:hypothetical protein
MLYFLTIMIFNNNKQENKKVLITYDASSLSNSNKVRFYYALKGRDGISGIMKLYNLNILSKKVFLFDFKYLENIEEFFKHWKIDYSFTEIIILSKPIIFNHQKGGLK